MMNACATGISHTTLLMVIDMRGTGWMMTRTMAEEFTSIVDGAWYERDFVDKKSNLRRKFV